MITIHKDYMNVRCTLRADEDITQLVYALSMMRGFFTGNAALIDQPTAASADEYDVLMSRVPQLKIPVIKTVRGLTGCPLKEAKDIVDSPLPVVVKSYATRSYAEAAANELCAVGAYAYTQKCEGVAQ